MKKTFTINLSGSIFHIEEDAYEQLQKYLVNLKQYFGSSEEGKEITADIEARIAEIFTHKISSENKVVTTEWVQKVIETMGTTESINDESGEKSHADSSKKINRRLYRDPEEKVLGGVCGGIAAYFDMDPVIVRIIFVVLALATTGAAILAYFIFWIAVPKAVTTAHRLEMRGEEVTIKNIEKFIKDEVDSVKESYYKFTSSNAR